MGKHLSTCRLTKALGRLASDVRGQFALITATILTPVMVFGGLAVDYHLAINSKDKVQYAMDSAVIVGARSLQDGKSNAAIESDVRLYFASMIEDEAHGLSCDPVLVSFPTGTNDVTANADCWQETALLGLIGADEIELSVSSSATFGADTIDIAMVFDVSGSMNSSASGSSVSKLEDLKTAALAAVSELLATETPPNPNAPVVRIAIAPYNHQVNAGSYFTAMTGENQTRDWPAERKQSGSWVGTNYSTTNSCIYEREGTEAFTDAPPGAGTWLGSGTPVWDFGADNTAKTRGHDWITPGGKSGKAHSGGGEFRTPFKQGGKSTALSVRYDYCPSPTIVPLTSNKTVLDGAVNALSASRGTNGSLGFAVGWYLIAPGWSSIWPTGSTPEQYVATDPESAKVIIMMTDGIFDDWRAPSLDQGDGWARAATFCNAAKAENIYIYSIVFDLTDTTAETTMRNCATSEKYFFTPSSGDELRNAYADIAKAISELRIKE